jgi:hypothetical protein
VKKTRRLEIVSETTSGHLHPLDPEIVVEMHVMATTAPHELDRLNLDARRKYMFRSTLSSDSEKLCGVVSFRNGEDQLACGRRRERGQNKMARWPLCDTRSKSSNNQTTVWAASAQKRHSLFISQDARRSGR